jgi:Sulfatase
MAEVCAGFLSHADYEIGRLLDYLEQSDQLENTMIVLVSDNGASGKGGPNGSVNENKLFNGLPDKIEDNLQFLDVLGTPLTYNHYPTGWAWAFNTPFKMWKRYSNYEGGTADPMIVSWPEGDAMPAEGNLTLHIGDAKVGEGRIKTQPGKFSIAGEGLNIGKDSAEPVSDDYPGESPWPFVGGTIRRAFVDVSGEPFVDLAKEAAAAFARD